MNPGDPLPADDHIVRYVKPIAVEADGTANGAAFCLRTGEEGLSVNWLEAFGSEKSYQLDEVRHRFRLSLSTNGRLAEMKVGTVLHKLRGTLDTPGIVYDPLEAESDFVSDPSHAQVIGLPPNAPDSDEAMLVGDLIAECVIGVHPAKRPDYPGGPWVE